MKKALFWTVYDRVDYANEVLQTWMNARGVDDWHFLVMIDPSPQQEEMSLLFRNFFFDRDITDFEIRINPTRLGAPENPYAGFEKLFGEEYEFVVLADDDLIVSDDILEYFDWACEAYNYETSVATVGAYSDGTGFFGEVELWQGFKSWLWGTWPDRWYTVIGPTWDHNYSTHNGIPGVEAGWDWNLNSRVLPNKNLYSARPLLTRCNNIGVTGIHGTAENFEQSEYFEESHPPVLFFS